MVSIWIVIPRRFGVAELLELLESGQPVEGELVEAVGPARLGVPERLLDQVALRPRPVARLLAAAAAAEVEREEGAALGQDRLHEGGKVRHPDGGVVVPLRLRR